MNYMLLFVPHSFHLSLVLGKYQPQELPSPYKQRKRLDPNFVASESLRDKQRKAITGALYFDYRVYKSINDASEVYIKQCMGK